jgi:DNA polymerase-3 subunit gamma/tau
MPSAPAANGSTSVMARDASGDSAGNQSRNPSGGTAGNPYDGADYAGEDSDRFAGNTTASAAGDSYDDSDPWAASQNPIQRNLTRPNLTSRNPMPAGAPTRSDAQEAPGREQVAPEEDEYSLNDESLGSATALDLDELARLFEVKSVEDFAADDPRNPKNIQPPNKSGKHQEG